MPKYFLHHRCASIYIVDPEGAEFANLADARAEAVMAARDQISRTVYTGWIDLSEAFDVEGPDGEGAVVLFSDAVRFRGGSPTVAGGAK
jgi:hypothetical protein